MPRHPRVAQPGFAYHVLNRAIGRARLFRSNKDYAAFDATLREASQRLGTPLLAWSVEHPAPALFTKAVSNLSRSRKTITW